jgi:hypothetical protein
LSDIASAGLGSATYGYLLQTGANQLLDLPWYNIDTITVQFSAPVTVNTSANGLALYGVNANLPTMSTPSNAIDVQTVTWKLSSFPGAGSGQVGLGDNQYMLALPDSAVIDAQGAPLDGAFTNSTSTRTGGASTTSGQNLPSGTGLSGSADAHGFAGFEFQFNVLPGDANQDYGVNAGDVAQIRVGLAGDYSIYSDIDGDGANAARDVALARVVLATSAVLLPSSAPTYPFSGSAAPLLVIAPNGSASMYLAAVSGSSAGTSSLVATTSLDGLSTGDSAAVLCAPLASAVAGTSGDSGTGIASGAQAGDAIAAVTRVPLAMPVPVEALPAESLSAEALPAAGFAQTSTPIGVAAPVAINLAASSTANSTSGGLVGIAANQTTPKLLGGASVKTTINADIDAAKQAALRPFDRSTDFNGSAPKESAASPSLRHAAIDKALQDFEF